MKEDWTILTHSWKNNMTQLPIKTKKERSIIYKKALLADLSKDTSDGLCIILRDLSGRSLIDWHWTDTSNHFPEFGKYYNPINLEKYQNDLYSNNIEKWRREVLNMCITVCEIDDNIGKISWLRQKMQLFFGNLK